MERWHNSSATGPKKICVTDRGVRLGICKNQNVVASGEVVRELPSLRLLIYTEIDTAILILWAS